MILIDILRDFGGAERSVYLLAKGLRGRGHRVIICCLKGGYVSEKMRQDGFDVKNLNVTKIYGPNGIKGLFRAVTIARKERALAIISYHESSDFLGVLVAFLARIPVLSSRRDMGFKLRHRHVWVYRIINRFFDHIITVSSAVKEVVLKTQWARPSDVTVIHNGVPLSSNSGKASDRVNLAGFDPGHLNICCVANIRPIKGQAYLISAASLVVKRFRNVRFFLIGRTDLDKAYYAKLQSQVRELRLEKVVKFTGELPASCVPSLVASMDISVLPSLSEGMSNTVLESMSAGKPIVATAVGGNPEVVEHGKTGYLVPPRDPRSMAKALLKLLANPKLRDEMGMRGRSRAESEFSVTAMVEDYENLLQYVCLTRELWLRRRLGSAVTKIILKGRSG
jgi:glycosyltransferase involved in cell wall biosynthesis